MILETNRLFLREYNLQDFPALYKILSNPITMQHYPKPYDEKGTHRWISWSIDNYEKHGFGWWALIRKDTGELIGDCGVTMQPIDGQLLPEIGYHIHHPHWRQGYGKEAAKAVRDWAFENTDYQTLYSYMTADNVASYATAASIGMRFIGEFEDGGYGLTKIYSITRKQWQDLLQKER